MAFNRVELDAIAATSLVKTYTTGMTWAPVLSLLQDMADSRMQRDAHLLTATISACECCGAWRHATQIQLQNVFLKSSLIAWNACLAASAAAAMWRLGLSTLQQLSWSTLQKDVVSCSSGLHACSLGKRWQDAMQLFSDMGLRGPLPNVIACGATISAVSNSARGGRWALTTLRDMQLQHLRISAVCFNAALSACACSFLWEECLALLRTMQQDKLYPTMVSFGAAMSAVEKVERWTEALGLLEEAFQAGLQPSIVAASSALTACKHEPQAWKLSLQHMDRCKVQNRKRKGIPIVHATNPTSEDAQIWPPNLILANTLSSTCESAGKWRQCAQILASLPTWRLQADEQTYGSFVSSLLVSKEQAKWNISLGILQQLQAAGLESDVVFLSLVLSLCEVAFLKSGWAHSAGSQNVFQYSLADAPIAAGVGQSPMVLLRMVEESAETTMRYMRVK